MAEKRISHDGVVDSLEENEVVVKITSYAACNDCHARGACQITETKAKYLRVKATPSDFTAGEKVRITISQSHGFRALFLGYVLPFLFVIAALLVATASGLSELGAGLVALSVLPPYYIGLKLFRGKLEQRFSFFLQKT